MRRFAAALLLLVPLLVVGQARAGSLAQTIREAQRKVVKVYGAGGLKGLEAYQTGILISPDGHVLTALSYVLDTDDLVVVLDDGRRLSAETLGIDPVRELAVLQVKTDDKYLPAFDLAETHTGNVGDRVLALSNLYGIAAGDEPVSALQGVITAIAPLSARRGSFESRYHGPAYIVDAAANNPGAAGGALVDWNGRLLGLLGKELRSSATGGWLNYALPISEIRETVDKLSAGNSLDQEDSVLATPDEPLSLAKLGIVLVPNVLPRTPPYIDAVFPGSPADKARLRPDDLIVFIDEQPAVSCEAAVEAIGRKESYEEVRVSILRDGKVREVALSAAPPRAEEESSRKDAKTQREDQEDD